jgi:hypothetical protein
VLKISYILLMMSKLMIWQPGNQGEKADAAAGRPLINKGNSGDRRRLAALEPQRHRAAEDSQRRKEELNRR